MNKTMLNLIMCYRGSVECAAQLANSAAQSPDRTNRSSAHNTTTTTTTSTTTTTTTCF